MGRCQPDFRGSQPPRTEVFRWAELGSDDMRTALAIALVSTIALGFARSASAQAPPSPGPQLPSELIPPPLPKHLPLPPATAGQTPKSSAPNESQPIEQPPGPKTPGQPPSVPIGNLNPARSTEEETIALQNEVRILVDQMVA